MRSNLLPIAQEGWKYLSYSSLFFLLFLLLDFDIFAFVTLLLILCFAFTFRNPERQTPPFEKSSFLSPSDGKVLSIEEIDDAEFAYKVRVESSKFDVALLRASTDQKLEKLLRRNGIRTSQKSKLFEEMNERVILNFCDANENRFKMIYTLKRSCFALHIDLIEGEFISKSTRYGTMVDGIATLYLPHNFQLTIQEKNELKAGESIIGYFS